MSRLLTIELLSEQRNSVLACPHCLPAQPDGLARQLTSDQVAHENAMAIF